MKIGIVTFYRVANYGAMLQAYALERYLEARGHAVVFIAHERCRAKRWPLWRCFVSRSPLGVRLKLTGHVRYPITSFAASFPQTASCRTVDDVRKATADCDAFIVGSDQMWNPMWCARESLPLVMLDFAAKGKMRLSYAASFGTTEWPNGSSVARAGELLRKFDRISVREESGVRLVKRLSGRTDAECLLDPTLLHPADFYREIIARYGVARQPDGRPYVFRYLLDEWDDAESSRMAFARVQAQLGLPRVETDRIPVSGTLGPLCRRLGVTAKVPVLDWLLKVSHADFVFTNSFHGTVFAILFHRPFVSLLLRGRMSGMNERLVSLLAKLNLSRRAVYADDVDALDAAARTPVDWDSVDAVLDGLRKETDAFFLAAFGDGEA